MGCQWDEKRPAISPVEKRCSFTGLPFVVSSIDAGMKDILQDTGFRTADVSKPDSGWFVGAGMRLIINRLYVRHFNGSRHW